MEFFQSQETVQDWIEIANIFQLASYESVLKTDSLILQENEEIITNSILDYVFRELAISYLGKEDLAHTPAIGGNDSSNTEDQSSEDQNQLLKIVKDITSKGFVRNNYKKNLVDLSDVKISLKGKK